MYFREEQQQQEHTLIRGGTTRTLIKLVPRAASLIFSTGGSGRKCIVELRHNGEGGEDGSLNNRIVSHIATRCLTVSACDKNLARWRILGSSERDCQNNGTPYYRSHDNGGMHGLSIMANLPRTSNSKQRTTTTHHERNELPLQHFSSTDYVP